MFCGRIFIFLFQGFPLGARSSVNPKGEFHKENITAYEGMPSLDSQDAFHVASQKSSSEESAEGSKLPPTSLADVKDKSEGQAPPLDEDDLYPIFWMMQEAFSNPPDYFFKNKRTEEFKRGLEATLAKFIAVPKVNQAAAAGSMTGEKRTASEMEYQDEIANTFNPKYLTSKELFSLEVCMTDAQSFLLANEWQLSDLAFQRHIVVQALILLDFLLSLTERAKKKLSHVTTQKAMQYEYTLSEQDVSAMLLVTNSHSLTCGRLSGLRG